MKSLSQILMTMIALGLIVYAWSHYTKTQNETRQAGNAQIALAQSISAQVTTPPAWSSCASDGDCVAVGTECCEGSFQNAVNKDFVSDWYAANPRQSCAADTVCTTNVPAAWCEQGQCRGGAARPYTQEGSTP
jgi:hypothetical protein